MILAIHTALPQMSLALIENQKTIDQVFYSGPTARAEDLLVWIQALLEQNSKSQKDIRALCLCYGPGAFTGLRLAAVTAKTLALAWDIPLYGFGLFEGIAVQLQNQNLIGKTQVSFHACRDQANNAVIEIAKDASPAITPTLAADEKTFWGNLPQANFYLGDYPDNLNIKNIALIPAAAGVGLLAERYLQQNQPSQLETLQVLYSHEPNVRLSDKPELLRLRQ